MTDPLTPEDRDALAGEWALGLLDGEEQGRAMRLRLSDPEFAAEVDRWSKRLEPLYSGFEESPPPALWQVIQRRLAPPSDHRLHRSLRRWRIGAIASGALAASLAGVLLSRSPPAPVVRADASSAIAQLGSDDAPAMLAVNYDPAAGLLRIRAVRLPESALVPELWVIPGDGVPRSLGLVARGGVSKVPISAADRNLLHDGVTLAITLERPDGAPHRAPSSTPVAVGKISTI